MKITPSTYQQAIFDWVEGGEGSGIVNAVAGSGKTWTIVNACKYIPKEKQCLFLAFNKSIAVELGKKVPEHVEAKTLNALGHRAWVDHVGRIILNPRKTGDICKKMLLGHEKRLTGEVKKLVGLAKSFGIAPEVRSRPGAYKGLMGNSFDDYMKLIVHFDIDVKLTDEATLIELARMVLSKSAEDAKVIDYDDQLWLPVICDLNTQTYDWVIVDEAQDLSPVQRKLVHMSMKPGGRLLAVGDPYQCQPAGTMISMTGAEPKPIEKIKRGDHVVSYYTPKSEFRGVNTQGRKVLEVRKRGYTGDLVECSSGGQTTQYTPNHRCLARMTEGRFWLLYIMRSGDRVRIGLCRSSYQNGSGIAIRAKQERADSAWILACYNSRLEGRRAEIAMQAKFGVPGIILHPMNGSNFDIESINYVFDVLGNMDDKLTKCLNYFGREIEFPIWTAGSDNPHVGTKAFMVRACNLVSGLMELRSFNGWFPAKVSRAPFNGFVYSLSVEPTEGGKKLYVANQIVTGNSIYGFRGAAHDSMDLLKKEFSCHEMPLSISYRCPKAVVKQAQSIVAHIKSAEEAPEGSVLHITTSDYPYKIGNMVVCRNSAPLVGLAYELLAKRVPVMMMGRDIGDGLVKLIDKLKPKGIDGDNGLRTKIESWAAQEIARAMKNDRSGRVQSIEDKRDSILAFLDGCNASTVPKLKDEINDLFMSKEPESRVCLSTIHKAKGLEAAVVFVYRIDLMPSKWASLDWQMQQEMNLMYVAYTRAMSELYLVTEHHNEERATGKDKPGDATPTDIRQDHKDNGWPNPEGSRESSPRQHKGMEQVGGRRGVKQSSLPNGGFRRTFLQ